VITEVRKLFIWKVYSVLTLQLLVCLMVIALFKIVVSQGFDPWRWWMVVLITLMLIIALCAVTCFQLVQCVNVRCLVLMRSYPTNYYFLIVLTSFEAVLLGFICSVITWQSGALAMGMALLVFLCMTILVWKFKKDFTGCGPYLCAALIVLVVFGIVVGIVVGILAAAGDDVYWLAIVCDLIAVLMFTFHIVADTQLIIGRYGGRALQFRIDDYVFAVIVLNLDFLVVGYYLIFYPSRLFCGRKRG